MGRTGGTGNGGGGGRTAGCPLGLGFGFGLAVGLESVPERSFSRCSLRSALIRVKHASR